MGSGCQSKGGSIESVKVFKGPTAGDRLVESVVVSWHAHV